MERLGDLLQQDSFRDREVQCRESDCRLLFALTAGEQRFYAQKGLNMPRRCPACRAKKRQQLGCFGEQVVSVDAVSGSILCRRCSRVASRTESLRTGQVICRRCSSEDQELPATNKDDELSYNEWLEHFRKRQEIENER